MLPTGRVESSCSLRYAPSEEWKCSPRVLAEAGNSTFANPRVPSHAGFEPAVVGDPGVEPGWVTPHAPQTCASTSSASRPAAAG